MRQSVDGDSETFLRTRKKISLSSSEKKHLKLGEISTATTTKMKTRARWPSLLACAFLMLQIRFEQQALADQQQPQPSVPPTPDAGGRLAEASQASIQHQLSLQQEQPKNSKPYRLSCHVCSTMDYENPNDNACKDMIKYSSKTASYYSAPMMKFHQTSMQPPTTETAAAGAGGSALPSMEPLVSSSSSFSSYPSPYHGESSTTIASTLQQQDLAQRNNSAGTIMMSPNSSAEFQQQQAITPIPNSSGYFQQEKVLYPKEFTRARTCSEEEGYCSIVSVVNLEFHNDKLIPKFWAMERNCSKSCNNGCMVIGERVRLRVCSSCCVQSNCNSGNGASKALNISHTQHTYQFVAILLVSLIMAKLSIHRSYDIM